MDQWRSTPGDSPADADDAASVWASDVPATDRAELSWDTTRTDRTDDDRQAPPIGGPVWGRLAVIGLGIAAIVGLMVFTVVSLARDDDPADADDSIGEEPIPQTTLDTLPSMATTSVPTSDSDDEEPTATDDDTLEEAEAAERDDGEAPALDGTVDPGVSVIELPNELAGFTQPFELVMDTPDGLATLSFPSGTLRTVEGSFQPQAAIVVAPDASFVPTTIGPVIVTRAGEVVTVEELPIGTSVEWASWSAPDGVTQFNAVLWDRSGGSGPSDNLELIRIGLDGAIISGQPVPRSFFWMASNGDRIVPDAGGTYAVAPDGSAGRISQGVAIGFTDDRVALRTCDVAYQCSLSVASLDGETPPTVFAPGPISTETFSFFNSVLPSPDGRAVLVPDPFSTDADEAIVRENGSRLVIDYEGYQPIGLYGPFGQAAWAPDSSGFFRTASTTGGIDRSGIVFVANNGDVIEMPGLPRNIGSIDIRTVESELPADPSDDVNDQ